MADMKRRVARAVAVLTIALAAGHLVQSRATSQQIAVDEESLKIDTVAENVSQPIDLTDSKVVPLAAETQAQVPPLAEMPAPAQNAAPAMAATDPAPALPAMPADTARTMPATDPVAPATPAQDKTAIADACSVTLDSFGDQAAMISLSLVAPCHPNERVVLRHAGLAVTEMTTSNGSLFVAIPALEKSGAVEIRFADGTIAETAAEVPELASVRRFGVQWQGDDAFQVHAFENGASYGEPGDVTATNLKTPAPGMPTHDGFLTVLGDPMAPDPLFAQIYSYPADSGKQAEVVIEAAVTAKTCGRELIGETLSSIGGAAKTTDLTLAMPECDGIGDYLVLNNLAPDLKITAEN